MLAFLGLGTQEIMLLAVLAIVPIVIAVIVLAVSRASSRSSDRTAALEDENRRLRAELDREREQSK
jgi:hypothetical protein